jgi:serine/threonine-protein phosphatase 2A activator
LSGAPDPSSVTSAAVVERERRSNLYFDAIGFIYDVKIGPFWEHSPTLYDISGVRAGWGKINKVISFSSDGLWLKHVQGMLKMYDAEVLGKFPVVQHFPFGSLFSFDRDPLAKESAANTHVASQPSRQPSPGMAQLQNSVRYQDVC